MSKYPLCEKLGLDVMDPGLSGSGILGLGVPYVFASKLEEVLERAQVVYAQNPKPYTSAEWSPNVPLGYPTHQALLLGIEPIKRKCEKHEPIGRVEKYGLIAFDTSCKYCGMKLQAEWKEA